LQIASARITTDGAQTCYNDSALGIEVIVRNGGTAAAGQFVVQTGNQTQTVPFLAPMGSARLWFAGYTNPVSITVDATSLVDEANEANNIFSGMLPIPTLPPPCTATPTPTATPTATAQPATRPRGFLPAVTR
jgi:hypothetical protein